MIKILNLVFKQELGLKSELFTTSKIISEFTQVEHHTVTRLIREYKTKLEKFGKVNTQLMDFKSINTAGRKYKIYLLNEQQATLLITFMKNTPVVAEFKTKLVTQFYQMREELLKRKVLYEVSKPIQKQLHEAIKTSPRYKDSDHLVNMYSTFNKLLLSLSAGLTYKQLKNRGVCIVTKQLLNSDELKIYKNYEQITISMLDTGADYSLIKSTLTSLAKQVS